MRRSGWIAAGGLVFLGLLCLITVGSAWNRSPMGWMMFSAPLAMTLFLIVLMLLVVVLGTTVYRLMTQSAREVLRCQACGRKLEPSWRLCPYCGERFHSSEDQSRRFDGD